MKPKIVIVGCGIVGALIAYELSAQVEAGLAADIVVIDKRSPADGMTGGSAGAALDSATGAALGVLMGIISHKVKGRTWRLREYSTQRYRSLIADLEQQGYSVPFNHQGIVSLCFDEGKLPRWQTLQEKRQTQGWPLEIWPEETLRSRCPQIALESPNDDGSLRQVKAAIYSPADGQVHPAALTQALVSAAQKRGVTFHWNATVTQLKLSEQRCVSVQTTAGDFPAAWVVLSAGLGSATLTEFTETESDRTIEPLKLIPVLGQAMEVQLPEPMGLKDFQPVVNGDDIQCVPLGEGRYWIGATVEFPTENIPLEAEAEGLENLQREAARFFPALGSATVLKTWSGLRPRPVGQPAPVIKPLGDLENVTLATGHYRNGVLLAPATAQQVCEQLQSGLSAKAAANDLDGLPG